MKQSKAIFPFSLLVIGLLLGTSIAFAAWSGHAELTTRHTTEHTTTADTLQIEEVAVTERWIRGNGSMGALRTERVGSAFLRQQIGGSLMHTLQALPGVQALTIGSGHAKPMIRGLGFNQ